MRVPDLNPIERRDRTVIAEGSEILGGVFLSRVGIVIDVDENPEPYQKAMDMIDARLAKSVKLGDELTNLEILTAVERTAHKLAPYNPRGYTKLLKNQAQQLGIDQLTEQDQIGLSTFITEREGVFAWPIGGTCQHYTLLNGALISLLQQRETLGGTVAVQSTRPDAHHPDRHTRIVFVDEPNKYIIDIATQVSEAPRLLLASPH